MGNEQPKVVKVFCQNCGAGGRNHVVLAEHNETEHDEFCGPYFFKYQICRCQGCDTVRFRSLTAEGFDFDESPGDHAWDVRVYPENQHGKRGTQAVLASNPNIGRIYKETVLALNIGANILCGGGLRAIVEAICRDQKATAKDLAGKIDALVDGGFLVKAQADLLHEERYIGNKALHEIAPPSKEDLELGLEIIEGLLNTIYVLPKKAAPLRESRERMNKTGTENGKMSTGNK